MITMDVRGLDELERQLTTPGGRVDTRMLRDARREALKVVEGNMKRHVGSDDAFSAEHMRDSIKIRASTREGRGNTMVVPRVGPSRKHYMKVLAQEFGMVKRAADPFIRPALDYSVRKVLHILIVEIRNDIQNRQQPLSTI